MLFSCIGGAFLLCLLVAASVASLHETIESVRQRGKVPVGASLLLAIYAGILTVLGGLVWWGNTIGWD